jgi:hypothetical protein
MCRMALWPSPRRWLRVWVQILTCMVFCEVSLDQSAGTTASKDDFGFKVLVSSVPAPKRGVDHGVGERAPCNDDHHRDVLPERFDWQCLVTRLRRQV